MTDRRENDWAMHVEFRQLRTLVMLVDLGSMTAVARALGVAQSTVSEILAALERALGTRLVTRKRGGHGISLTAAGEALLPHARRILASLEDAQLGVASVDRDVRGSLEVIASESVSTYLLPRALRELRKRWPNTQFAVTVGTCARVTEGLASGRYDVGLILQTHCANTGAGSLFLTQVPLVVFAAAKHPLASPAGTTSVQRHRLAAFTLFVSDASGDFFDLLDRFFRVDGMPSPRLEPTGSVEAVKHSVATNPHGLGVLPLYALGEELRGGQFQTLSIEPEVPQVRLEAAMSPTRPSVHPAMTALLDVLRA